jgi:uncharacterized protein (TIGR02611 family)
MNRIKRHSHRVFIAVVGGTVTLIGIVLIPYPGPGWLIVFAGLAILSTEFEFASRLLERLRGYYDRWLAWLKVQPRIIQGLVIAASGVVVVFTLWLLNSFGFLAWVFGLDLPWLSSPFFR